MIMTDEMDKDTAHNLELKRLEQAESRVKKIEAQAENLGKLSEVADGLAGGLEVVVNGLEVVGDAAGLASNFLGRRKFMKSHHPVNYQTPAENWRWSSLSPELGFGLNQEADLSCLSLNPDALRSKQWIPSLAGLALMGLGFCLGGSIIWGPNPPPVTSQLLLLPIVLGFCLGGGYALSFMYSNLAKIDLTPQTLVLHLEYGFYLTRKIHYSRQQLKKLAFQTKPQSFLSQDRGQKNPLFYLQLNHKKRRKKRWLLSCNPTQAAWIEDGLNYWLDPEKALPQRDKSVIDPSEIFSLPS